MDTLLGSFFTSLFIIGCSTVAYLLTKNVIKLAKIVIERRKSMMDDSDPGFDDWKGGDPNSRPREIAEPFQVR